VNKIPSIIEYLGNDYPMYFTSRKYLENILNDNTTLRKLYIKTYEYLKNLNKIDLTLRYFATEFPISIILHLSEKNRQHIDSISSIPVALADGGSFPLSEVVSINEVEDIVSIPRLFGKRYSSLSIYLKNTEYEKFIDKLLIFDIFSALKRIFFYVYFV
jgi:hypothetical protein